MTAKWKNNGFGAPTVATVFSDRMTDVQQGLETALSDYSGTSDPSSGAPVAWGAAEVGFKWLDTTNQRFGGGDDLGSVLKRWERTGAAGYDWRTLNAVSWIPVSPITNVLNAVGTNTVAMTDLDLTTVLTSYTTRALCNIQVIDRDGVGTGVFAAFRQNGVTADAQTTRLYPSVVSIPVAGQFWVGVDSGQIFEYQVAPSSGTGNLFDLRIDVVAYQERI